MGKKKTTAGPEHKSVSSWNRAQITNSNPIYNGIMSITWSTRFPQSLILIHILPKEPYVYVYI